MTKDLTTFVQAVFAASTLEAKKTAMLELIEVSYAKNETKAKARRTVETLKSPIKLDAYAANYMMSGEGMKVR